MGTPVHDTQAAAAQLHTLLSSPAPDTGMSFFMSNARRGPKEEARYRREIRKMFDKADKDGDGKLTKDEWFNVLNSSGCETSMAEVSEFFDRMDRDFDGRLSFGEFMGEETPLEKVFKNMDKDGDGTVSKEEFTKLCKHLTPQQVEEGFAKFDTSGDNRLDYREFCSMIHAKQQQQNKK